MNDTSPPELIVERVAMGELPREELGADGDSALNTLKESDEEILSRYRPEEIAPAIERRLSRIRAREAPETTSLPWWKHLVYGAPLAAAAMLLMLVIPSGPNPHPSEQIKGEAQLVLQRPTAGEGRELLSAQSVVRPGDRIQIGYRFSSTEDSPTFGVIISLDGSGAVTAHLPEKGRSARLDTNVLSALPHSFMLDDAPRFERFFFVTHREPFALDSVVRAAEKLSRRGPERAALGTLALPPGLAQTSILLRKE